MAYNIEFSETVLTKGFRERANSPSFTLVNGKFKGTRILELDNFNDALPLTRELLGGVQEGFNSIRKILPHRFPLNLAAVAESVQMTPHGKMVDIADPQEGAAIKALLTVGYEEPDGDSKPSLKDSDTDVDSVIVTERLEPNVEFVTRSPEGFFWELTAAGDPKDIPVLVDELPGFPVFLMDWVYTIHEVPVIPREIFSLINKVNNKAVTSKRLKQGPIIAPGNPVPFKFPAETLLFNAPSLSRKITNAGAEAWTITIRLTYRDIGWNVFFRREKVNPQKMKHIDVGGDINILEPVDFSGLISADFDK